MIESIFPHAYSAVRSELAARLAEPAPGRAQILSGPRQVGKTHLLRELEQAHAGVATYAAADAPAAALPGWWEALWSAAQARARQSGHALLLIDEIQYLPDWGRRLKAEADRIGHERVPLHVVVSGSSSLGLGQGTRETMAGRFEYLRLLHWPARELVRQFGMTEEKAVEAAAETGTYPGAVALLGQPARWKAYVRDAIVEPAVGRDLLALEVIRRPALLRQIFALAVGHPAEIVSLQKLRGQLADPGALETVAHYLQVLESAYLVAALPKFSLHEVRRRSSPPKLVVLNQGILAALSGDQAATTATGASQHGRRIENACLALAWNAGQTVAYWRQEPFEVDIVTTGSWGRWAVEVKTGPYSHRDLAGLFEFCSAHRDFAPLVVCAPGEETVAHSAGITSCTWQEFLLSGPPGIGAAD